MIRHILRLWSDDELRPAIKMLSVFIVIATMVIKLGFADSTLLGSFLAAIALTIPFAFAFNYVAALVRDKNTRLKLLGSLGATLMVFGAGVAFGAINQVNVRRNPASTYPLNADQPNPAPAISANDEAEDRKTLYTGIALVGFLVTYGGYKLLHWSAYRQGQLCVRQES